MLCQVCGANNPDEQEYCSRCHQKLLVVSGVVDFEEREIFESNPEEQFSFDEHLLERISILEEVVRRTADTVRQMLGTVYKLEQKILINQTGITSLRDLLAAKGTIGHEEWTELWEPRMDYQLLALEKRERFAAVKDRIAALYQGRDLEGFQERLDRAETALMSFDVEAAIGLLEEAHHLDPRNHELAFFLGETFFNEGEGETALGYFSRVLEIKGDHYESLVFAGVLCHERGDGGRAEELLRRAVSLYPDAFLPAFSLGAVYAGEDKLPQAVLLLERAVDIEAVPQAYYLLGSCLYEMGKVTLAIRRLREAVRLDPAFESAHFLLGLACLDRRWYRKALEAFRQVQRLNPKTLRYEEMVRFLDAKGIGHLPEVGELASVWVMQAERSLRQGERRHALSFYRRALLHDGDNPALLVAYAMACLELDRGEEIRAVVDKALGLEPSERLRAMAYATLIEALRSEGRYREGNRLGRELLSEAGSDLSRSVACYEMACNLAEMEEDLDQALSFARRSLELSPDDLKQFPLAALGWVHYKRRELDQAIDCLSRSSEIGASAQTLTHLGMALLAAGNGERARRVLVRAHDLQEPGSAFEDKVLECLRDSARFLRDVQAKPRK